MTQMNNLQRLMKNTASEMERLGYSPESMGHYSEIWNRYLRSTHVDAINRKEINRFLADRHRF
ncbi:hypothetical protein [Muricomes intestini]|jgi:hypothetical protein|uniref:hypothetical protein n=1 Tax=Muricomes intestini TaxID=1796634 RepID=UPI002FDECB85